MTPTAPDPQVVRKIARVFLAGDNQTEDELYYAVRRHTYYDLPNEEFKIWREAVRADAKKASVTKCVAWADEQPDFDPDAGVRAVAALLKLGDASFHGQWLTDFEDARAELVERFAGHIAALEARDTKGTL